MRSEALSLDDELQRLADEGPAWIHLQSGSYICRKLDEAASLLRTQAARIAELEADYARLLDKHNALHINSKAARAERDQLRTELTEQARIVGMGAERELALIAERDQLHAEVERLRKPLTDEQIDAACSDIYLSDYPQGSASYDVALARAIEAAKESGEHE